MQFTRKTLSRAKRAIACSPFTLNALQRMRVHSIDLTEISGDRGFQNTYTRHSLPELKAEKYLLWLIQVGVLRREVDGQGLTDSFRLTPLGRQILDLWQSTQTIPKATWGDRLKNLWTRAFSLSFYLQ
jgi:hypothetical protein